MSVPDTPEFRKALEEACDRQYGEWLYGGGVKVKERSQIEEVMKEHTEAMRKSLALRASAAGMNMAGMPELPEEVTFESMEKYRAEMEAYSKRIRAEAERQGNEHYREITRELRKRGGYSGLICPVCGEEDHGNKMNGKPVCMMNAKHGGLGPVPLMSPEKAREWKPPEKPKARSYTFDEPDGVVKVGR